MQVDFLLPSRIESDDRLRNVITSVTFLLSNFPESKVYIKEVDKQSNFKQHALPVISKYTDTNNLVHIFEKSEEQFFHKTRILNDLLLSSNSELVVFFVKPSRKKLVNEISFVQFIWQFVHMSA